MPPLVPPVACAEIQKILTHSNVNVTLGYYVQSASPHVLAGMQKLSEKLGGPALSGHLRDTKTRFRCNARIGKLALALGL